ncbi:protein BCCIP homolog [Babylonia areolata]|uniref:protein BCCIP homolog n=1 Tax=Babylonia areolata TaxID=304850 RepID=UPI003FD48473
MASSKKKRALDPHDPENLMVEDDEPHQESDDDATDESENEFMDQEVQVEFEARPPEDSDFHGIKTLLQQLFLKANINLSDFTDIIISQNYVGGVIKQVDVDEEDDDSMDDDSGDSVFGIVTAINLTDKKDKECIKQLINTLTSHCQSVAPEVGGKVTELLHQTENHVGFFLNERFINIPPQIAVPSFQSLRKDLEKANEKKRNYSFKHLIMLCKTYQLKGASKTSDSSLFFSNGEEELIAEMSDIQVTWSVADERDGVADGRWDEDEMEATRTLLVFSADKLDAIISRLEKELAT